ncbi:major facilitator superfamily domain-containing protein [Scleroderma yunnanense]
MSSRTSTDRLLGDVEIYHEEHSILSDVDHADVVFGGPEKRKQVEKKLLRKLDLRVFFLVLVGLINYMDKTNIAAARLKGLEEDLHLTGQQFNSLLSILYAGFVLMQIPSNMFLNQLRRPSVYLSCCIVLWGLFSITTACMNSFRSALISRFFLGFSEAVFSPAVVFILSRWYKRNELGLRLAYFICASSVSKVFGPLIASGIVATMDGILGYAAWRWLFFIEGGVTCMVAIPALYLVPDFPTTPASWLTVEEQMLAQKRMAEDLCGLEQKSSQQSGLVEAFTDWNVWWLAFALTILDVALSFGDFFPTLVATMGYSETTTLLLCSPPWVLGVITSLFVMRHSDSTRDRFWHTLGPVSLGVIGFVLATLTMNTTLRYLSLFFMTQSTVAYVVLLAWVSNSVPEPQSKQAVALAFVNVLVGLGATGTPYIWPATWGPSYSKSFLICILASIISILMLWVHRLHLIRLNRRAERKERALGLPKGFRYIT